MRITCRSGHIRKRATLVAVWRNGGSMAFGHKVQPLRLARGKASRDGFERASARLGISARDRVRHMAISSIARYFQEITVGGHCLVMAWTASRLLAWAMDRGGLHLLGLCRP